MSFDLTVHRRNAKGEVIGNAPYRLEINGGIRRFERPIGSGIWYNPDGELLPEGKAKLEEMEKAAADKKEQEQAKKAQSEKAAEELQAKAAKADSLEKQLAEMQSKLAAMEKKAAK